MTIRRAALLVGLAAITFAGIVMSVVLGDEASIVLPVAYGVSGAYLVARRPMRPIGWLLIVIGWGVALGTLRVDATAAVLLAGDLDPLLAFTTWTNTWGFSMAFAGLTALTVVFPDERLPTGWWGVVGVVAIVVAVVISAVIAIAPETGPTPDGSATSLIIPNPYALAPDAAIWRLLPSLNDLFTLMLLGLVVSGIGLIVRSRQAVGAERLQYRWFITSLALVLILSSFWAITVFAFAADALGPTWVLAILGFAAVPVAITVAVMRYRLFEIDRIISRTIGWAVITGLLLAVFAVGVLGLQALLSDVTQGETLAVAASTLVAFALFQPIRKRVQRAVDRRFFRARYDAEQTTATLAARLRDDLDLGTVRSETLGTVVAAVRPTTAALWLREGRP